MRMMKHLLLWSVIGALYAAPALAEDTGTRIDTARVASKSFMTQLKSELQAAMKAGGPVRAIEVCHARAPAIAAQISEQNGWRVARTSLKPRNPANAPDAWERAVLEKFEARKAAGEPLAKMEYSEVVERDGQRQFRYMKAIPAGQVCLNCHGRSIAPAVKAKLDELYPQDRARGYAQGDIRGAFTITQPM